MEIKKESSSNDIDKDENIVDSENDDAFLAGYVNECNFFSWIMRDCTVLSCKCIRGEHSLWIVDLIQFHCHNCINLNIKSHNSES